MEIHLYYLDKLSSKIDIQNYTTAKIYQYHVSQKCSPIHYERT